jgi:N-hydroxyarylamine O-acetyltransferase
VRIEPAADGDVDVLVGGAPQYRLEARARVLADFEPTCWWHQTSPKSHFTQSLVCSLPVGAERVTLSGRTLIETVGGERVERVLADDAEVRAAYADLFGIVLDRLPTIPAAEPVGEGSAVP